MSLFKKVTVVSIFFFLVSNLAAYSYGLFDFSRERRGRPEIYLEVGEVSVIKASSPERVSVRNPEIVDIVRVRENEVVIAARRVGETVLNIWENGTRKAFFVKVSLDVAHLKERLKKLIHNDLGISQVNFRKNELDGKVMIMGTVTTTQKERIDKALESFYGEDIEEKLFYDLLKLEEERRMVMIEITVMELSKSFADTLGFNWPGTAGLSPSPMFQITTPPQVGSFRDIFRISEFARSAFTWDVMLAAHQGKGSILARPKLLCLSGEEANFLVGGEVPVLSTTATAEGAVVTEDVDYKSYGIDLNIRPLVTDDGQIRLDIRTEVKELSSEGEHIRADGTTIKAFVTREVSTTLRLEPGQEIVMSGLIKDKVTKDDIKKVPGLERIPILGALFRSKDYLDNKTELVISLVPHLVDMGRQEIVQEADVSLLSPVSKPIHLPRDVELDRYILRVQGNINQALSYPDMAREAGWQGSIRLKLHLNRDGKLLDVKTIQPSGYITFDREVLNLVKSLSYPSFPPNLKLQDLWVEVPVVYQME